MKWTKEMLELMRGCAADGLTGVETAARMTEALGQEVTGSAVRSKMTEIGMKSCSTRGERSKPSDGPGMSVDERGDSQVLTLRSRTVRTLEGALKAAGVDLCVWDVERHVINKWDQGSKQHDGTVQVVELWQVKVWLKRAAPKPIVDAFEELCKRLPVARSGPLRAQAQTLKDPHLLELALFDAHFGKLCWGHETGSAYDVKIASSVYADAVSDLLARVRGYPIERVLYPLGQDFFQVDNWVGTTHAGTQVDTDGRFQRTFEAGVEAVIRSVELCLKVAPVKMIWVPGNHDRTTSWYLAKLIQAHFRNDDRVVVNASPQKRKYCRYGAALIGFTHGDEEPHRDLPTIMASEAPRDWAEATCREWHVGHWHKRKEMRFSAGDAFGAVGVRVLPSLSGCDAWHYDKGFVKTARAAEAYLWSKREGYVGHFAANVREREDK